ncbi:nucleotidyltransferase family protein [Cohnella faecalis]|uniref:Nucleotidyltransferase family protein n=1 Tax=Cohnella faecalis TaxID=2315694 RepID=A0A398CL38_9BACL|nr:nucleotidyltransferase family protein [Cohnella faecalis]RIE03373.1 nucleotidyltransferase family protein [Cohnella faecalis]
MTHFSSDHLEQYLIRIIEQNKLVYDFLNQVQKLKINHYYIGAGCITQTVWNHLCGMPLSYGIKDIDFVYFDDDLSEQREEETKSEVERLFSELPFKIDVKNQARVHLWYKDRFGYEIKPYRSLEDAINTWPTTATALGARISGSDWDVYAPFGLEDLFGMIVRPNKAQITKEIYEDKVRRWKGQWDKLIIVEW